MPTNDLNPRNRAGNSKAPPLRMAVVGAGAMGRAHCQTIHDDVDEVSLAAVVDVHVEAAREVGDRLGVPAFESVEKLLAAGVAEAALVATPHPLHLPAVEACLAAGLHVICEKPMAETVSAADRMLAAARRAGRAFGVMFQRRVDPVFASALDFVRGGNLGDIVRTLLVLPDFRSQAYYDANVWRATWKGEGGGVLINQAPHMIDLFTLFGGLPKSLTGHVRTHGMHDIEVEDQAEALLRYPGGGTGYVYASTTEPKHHEMLEIVGTRGSVCFRHGKMECLVFDDDIRTISAAPDENIWRRPEIRDVTPAVAEVPINRLQGMALANFSRHIRYDEPLRCDAESARLSLELANAITLSSHLGREVALPIDRAVYDALLEERRAASRPKRCLRESRATDPRLVASSKPSRV